MTRTTSSRRSGEGRTASAGIRVLGLGAWALLALGATCARRPAGGGPPDAPAVAAAEEAASGRPDAGAEPAVLAARPTGRLFGLIAPHAGYMYSGAVAGHAWKLLVGRGAPPPADETAGPRSVFPPQVAGGFYPADPTELRAAVERYLADATPPIAPAVGPVGTVVVLAPSHHYPLAGAAALADDAYQTPLGLVRVDTTLRGRLAALAGDDLVVDSSYFRREHAVEVQLPFLQVALPEARVLPLVVGDTANGVADRLGAALAALCAERPDLVVVASSDMSHFFPYDEAVAFDEENLRVLEALDLATFDRTGQGLSGLCGFHPVRTALIALRTAAGAGARVLRLRYANSGDVTGERDRVVGYGALALLAAEAAPAENASTPDPPPATAEGPKPDAGPQAPAAAGEATMYTREERRTLLDIAKAAVRAAVRGESYRPPEPAAEALRAPGAAFVTLRKQGNLRGCIGHVVATLPLYRCVAEVAEAAATQDYRFDPVTPQELDQLTFEISVLTPPEVVTDPATIRVGRDGLIVSRGRNRGLLLPQVPGEQGWNREQFLDGTCRKAGLPAGCWRDPETRLERFQAVVWGEDLEDVLS